MLKKKQEDTYKTYMMYIKTEKEDLIIQINNPKEILNI